MSLGGKCNKTQGAPSFAFFAKGGIQRISMRTVEYPTNGFREEAITSKLLSTTLVRNYG
jgi:hypothetical protein